jgi:hypothetical protein
MRQWLEAGYFKGDLPISQVAGGPFHPLSIWFPNLHFAFMAQPTNGNDALVGEKAKAEAAEIERLRQEKEAVAERERLAAEEAKRLAEAAAKKEAEEREAVRETERRQQQAELSRAANEAKNGGNVSSTQLKMMLGLSRGTEPAGGNTSEDPEPAESKKSNKAGESKASKATNKKGTLKSVEDSLGPAASDGGTVPAPPPPSAAPAAPAWGGVASNKPRKSMSEIQQEEARAAAVQAAMRGNAPQPSSGWANVAAGTSAWSSGTLRQSSVVIQNPATAVGRSKAQSATSQGGASRKVAPITQQQRASSTGSSTPAEEFGTSMPPALEKWCKEKMVQINGSDDLTLVAFCMTLNDAGEIRQYLTTYLGHSASVNSFATEFINKRGLGGKQEEWETPGSAKKGRKKKSSR